MMRQEYVFPTFDRDQLREDPIELFNLWFKEAEKIEMEANAMTLATVSSQGQPSARVVLLKEISEGGLVFFGNHHSRKIQELESNPHAALLFYWEKEKRQVRFSGICHKITAAESDDYFSSRPYASQIGAWASFQSEALESRAELEARVDTFSKRYPKGQVPRPPHWGGFRLLPHEIEFWQGRLSRLHDRFVYQKVDNEWKITRLNP